MVSCAANDYNIRTEQSYVDWIKRFILFHGKRHPKEMGKPEVTAFLTHLAVQRNVASSTQNQALSAILFLYREVLELELEAAMRFAIRLRPICWKPATTSERCRNCSDILTFPPQ